MSLYYLILWNQVDILQNTSKRIMNCPYAPLDEVLRYVNNVCMFIHCHICTLHSFGSNESFIYLRETNAVLSMGVFITNTTDLFSFKNIFSSITQIFVIVFVSTFCIKFLVSCTLCALVMYTSSVKGFFT